MPAVSVTRADGGTTPITIDREDLLETMMGQVGFPEQVASGKARLEGDPAPFELLMGMLVDFELGFEIMPGTAGRS